ncbi:MAG: hypothetical protein V9H25_18685 [Candidatus Competibacter sp.]
MTIPTLPIANPQISTRIIEGRITPTQDCYSDELRASSFPARSKTSVKVAIDYLGTANATTAICLCQRNKICRFSKIGDIVLTIDGVLSRKRLPFIELAETLAVSATIWCGFIMVMSLPSDYLTSYSLTTTSRTKIKSSEALLALHIPGIRTSMAIDNVDNHRCDQFLRPCVFRLPHEKQADLVTAMDAARAEHWAKLAEADALLAGLDGYVLETLGLPANPSQRFVFAIRFFDVKNNRTDPDFHSLRSRAIRDTIESGRFSAYPVSQLCTSIVTGFAAGKHEQAFDFEAGVPHLRPLNLNIYGELSIAKTKFVPKEAVGKGDWCQRGDVLFNNTNSTEMVGKSAVFDLEQPCACSNHMTRLKPLNHMNAEFLAAVLNALRSLGYLGLLSTNFNNQAGINTATLSVLRLPCPPKAIQDAISAEVCRRREEARRLRADAEAGWQAAKRWFEEQLLGPVQA